jgi:hypothetical protein
VASGRSRSRSNQPGGGVRAEDGVSVGDRADRVDDALGWIGLDHEADGSRLKGVVDVFLDAVRGEHADPGSRSAGDEAAGGLDAVELGHPDVHQHDVRVEPVQHGKAVVTVCGLADDLQVVVQLEDGP